jgi:uncharacterized membrane protein
MMAKARKLKDKFHEKLALKLVKGPGEARSRLGFRNLELDAFRGFAILLMIGFHITHDLRVFGPKSQNAVSWLPQFYWDWFPEFIGILFFSIVGISARVKFDGLKNPEFKFFMRQALKVGVCALIITAVTAYFTPKQTIVFGTLHCIAICSILIYPFLKNQKLTWWVGGTVAAFGFVLEQMRFSSGTLFWLGFAQKGQTGGDWYPLMPWFGVILLGSAAGKYWIENFMSKETAFNKNFEKSILAGPLSWMGRHSLSIYLLHQPILITLLSLLGWINLK